MLLTADSCTMADLELLPQHLHPAEQEECQAPSQALLGETVARNARA